MMLWMVVAGMARVALTGEVLSDEKGFFRK